MYGRHLATVLLLLHAQCVYGGEQEQQVPTITITTPSDDDFVSGRVGVESVDFEAYVPPAASQKKSKWVAAFLVEGQRTAEQTLDFGRGGGGGDGGGGGTARGKFSVAPFAPDAFAKLHLQVQLEEWEQGSGSSSGVVAAVAAVSPRVAIDTYVESEHGNYALWMPPWLAGVFAHLFEIDDQGRQTMPPLEQYLTLQDLMIALPKDSVLLDVGAHIGQSAMPVAAAGYKVVSVEPVHSSALLLLHNARQSGFEPGRLQVIEAVASDQPGEHTLFVPIMQDNACLSRTGATLNMKDKNKVREVSVPRVVLDDWLDEHPDIRKHLRFIKIDTQGFELFVLRGLRRFLTSPPGKVSVLTEWDEKLMKHAGVNPADVEAIFRECGFTLVEDGGDRLYTK